MPFVYEINGQRVEFDREPTDADIDEAARNLAAPAAGQRQPGEVAGMMAAPGVTGAAMATPTGAERAGRVVTGAVAPYVKEVGASYMRKPINAAVDVGLTALGGVPVMGPVQGYMDRARAIQEGMTAASREASAGTPGVSAVRGTPTTSTVGPYFEMRQAAAPEVQAKLTDAYRNHGGNNGVKAWLNSAEGQAYQRANPEFAARAAKYVEAAPSLFAQAGRMVRPLAVGAARIAGPAGLAYDVYEAGQQYVPPAGPVGPQMAQARRAMLNAPTPAPLTGQEAQNLLSSGDVRTINVYGGADRLQQIIRQEAARRAMAGPIAPAQ